MGPQARIVSDDEIDCRLGVQRVGFKRTCLCAGSPGRGRPARRAFADGVCRFAADSCGIERRQGGQRESADAYAEEIGRARRQDQSAPSEPTEATAGRRGAQRSGPWPGAEGSRSAHGRDRSLSAGCQRRSAGDAAAAPGRISG